MAENTKSKTWVISGNARLPQLGDVHHDQQGTWMLYCSSRSGDQYQFDYNRVVWNGREYQKASN